MSICDISQKVVEHGNKQEEGMFEDITGLLCQDSAQNLKDAKDGILKVELNFPEHETYAQLRFH